MSTYKFKTNDQSLFQQIQRLKASTKRESNSFPLWTPSHETANTNETTSPKKKKLQHNKKQKKIHIAI